MNIDKNVFVKKEFTENEINAIMVSSKKHLEFSKSMIKKEAKLVFLFFSLIKYCLCLLARKNIAQKNELKDYKKLIETAAKLSGNEDIEAIGKKIVSDYNETLNYAGYEIHPAELELLTAHFEKIAHE